MGLAAVTAPGADDGPLLGFLPQLAFVLGIWLLGWPVVETVRLAAASTGRRRRAEGLGMPDPTRRQHEERLGR